MATIPALPASLKQIQHYMKTAAEHETRDPVVAYYSRLFAMQSGMEIDKKSPEARSFLVGLMDYLEQVKTASPEEDAIQNELVGQAHMENYALKVFLFADNEDRASRFNKNVVKSFYTAGMLFDVLRVFGELSEEIEKTRTYAKWKAAYIHKCLKNGETPIAGPLNAEGEEGNPGLGFDGMIPQAPSPYQQPGMSVNEPDQGVPSNSSLQFPAAGVQARPSTPQDPPQGGYVPASVPVPAPRQPPQNSNWVPPPNPGGVVLTTTEYQKALKLCKFASSAIQYEDAETAIENLTKALTLLSTGKES